ncbi:MAG: ExbD/TolR family protein [Proteobacteria bacterium]|nr:ExbD/TolR family protein [Pseudomonadota bacterium]
MAMSGGSGGSLLAEINVTPMVDVMLVLLVIFMITAPMLEQGVDVNLPRAEAQEIDAEQKKLVLSIDGQRRLYLGRSFVPFSQLFDKLKHNEKLQVERELFLRADRGLPYGLIVRVMALARQAGIDKVGMITESAPEGELGAESEAGLAVAPPGPRSGARP